MNVFNDICRGLREGKKLFLATIIRSSGSVPAPVHSRMLVVDDGRLTARGTVGGGCLDGAVLKAVRRGFPGGRPATGRFNLNDALGDTEFTCGGTVEIMVEPLREDMLPVFDRLEAELRDGRDCIVRTTVPGEGPASKSLYGPDGRLIAPGGGGRVDTMPEAVLGTLNERATARIAAAGGEEDIFEFIESPPPLVVFGGGHVGRAIARFAYESGFSVTVVDDRPEYADPGRFPGGCAVMCELFDRAVETLHLSERSSVVIVTRGHRHDELILEKCAGLNLRYLGMIGSRRKVELAFDRLRQAGIPGERLSGVHAPIGLPIGARTAEEIAISAVAELIAVRRMAPAGYRGAGPSEAPA